MQKVLLVMHRKVLAQSLIRSLQNDPKFTFYMEPCPDNVLLAIINYNIDVAVVEVPESGEHPAEEMLFLCDKIKKTSPDCKTLVLCPETSEESKDAVVVAKKHGGIDDFIFYDSSLEYLTKKLESMG